MDEKVEILSSEAEIAAEGEGAADTAATPAEKEMQTPGSTPPATVRALDLNEHRSTVSPYLVQQS